MPGSSLWLLPPRNQPLYPALCSLISETAKLFGSEHTFLPHVTLTSDINSKAYGSDPQAWLESLPFPKGIDVRVHLGILASEDVFVRKLYSKVDKDGLESIGKMSRMTVEGYGDVAAQSWAEERYMPHLSLLYHDCPKIEQERIKEVEKLLEQSGVRLDGQGKLGCWTGGMVVLVDTSKPIKEWVPLAERAL